MFNESHESFNEETQISLESREKLSITSKEELVASIV